MQKIVGSLFILFGLLEFVAQPSVPDTMQALVLVRPPTAVSWMFFPVGALLCFIFGIVTLCTKHVGLYGVAVLAAIYLCLHFVSLFHLPCLEYGVGNILANPGWLDIQVVASLVVWVAVVTVVVGCIRRQKDGGGGTACS